MRRGFRVEFLGLPAAGKTSVVRATVPLLEASGLTVEQPMERAERGALVVRRLRSAKRIGASAIRRPGFVTACLRAVAASGQASFGSWLKVTHHLLHVCALAREPRSDVHARLFDQGPYQAVWSVAFSGRNGSDAAVLDRLVDLVPAPDLLVVLRVPQRHATQRMAARTGGRSRIDQATSVESREALMDHGSMLLETVLMSIERSRRRASGRPAGSRVLDLGDEAVEENARRLADAIERHLPA